MNTHEKDYDSVLDLVKDSLPEDAEFAAELQDQVSERRLVRQLADLRNQNDVSQEDVANILGCTQSRVSKIENGLDKSISVEELGAYAKALDCDLELIFRGHCCTLVDEIKYHAFCIRNCFDKMTELASRDEEVAQGVADFHVEALFNLANIVRRSHGRLPKSKQHGLRLQVFDKDRLDCFAAQSCGRSLGDRSNISATR
jgi:transcriptional regulator with XRE-family HTH domain